MKKTPTIFLRNEKNRQLVTDTPHPACEWVFNGEGKGTKKYDGTCCRVLNGKLYKRRELKPSDKIPDGFEIADYDEETGKTVGWLPVSNDDPADKWHVEAFHYGLLDGTYELIGEKIQGNPEKAIGHWLIKHSDAVVLDCPREYNAMKEYLDVMDIEGIVFHHPDGRMAKIKKRDFGLKR